jgi:CRP-like cAMP-binding protein
MSSVANTNEAQELRRLIPLNTLPAPRFEQVCMETRIEEAPKGEVLFHQGDATNEFVYVLSGTVSLQAGGVEMDSVAGGTETARFALAHQNPRKVSAVAKDRVRYVRVHTSLVNQREESQAEPLPTYSVSHSAEASDGDWISALLRSPVFQRLPPSNLQTLLRSVEEIQVQAGEVICRQDDPGDYFYIIKQGQCVLTRKPSPGAREIKLATLKGFETFGEDALISDKPRTVTITMATDGQLLRLDKASFLKLVRDPVISRLGAKEAIDMVRRGGMWLDVRMPDAHQQGHPRGSLNAPFFSLRMTLPSLDRQKKYVLVCEDGKLSEAGAYLLLRFGFEAYVLKGGIGTLPAEETSSDKAASSPHEPSPGPETSRGDTDQPGPESAEADEPDANPAQPQAPMPSPSEASAAGGSAPQRSEEMRQDRERLANAEHNLQRMESELKRLLSEKEQSDAELEQMRLAATRLKTAFQSLKQDHERLLHERQESAQSPEQPGIAAQMALQQEVEELKALCAETQSEKDAAEQEAASLRKQVGELKAATEKLIERSRHSSADEVNALRAELESVRQQASAELAALQTRLSEAETENARLQNEAQAIKTQLAVHEAAVAAESADIVTSKRFPAANLLWLLAAGLLSTALVLGGLFGLKPGREMMRSWLGTAEQPASEPATGEQPPGAQPAGEQPPSNPPG